MKIVLNSGSSSQKACLYRIGESLPADPPALREGRIEWANDTADVFADAHGVTQRRRGPAPWSGLRDILAAMRQGHQRAKLAFDIYSHRIRAAIGGMSAILGGMGALVLTRGVGENWPDVRAVTCTKLGELGLRLDSDKNIRLLLTSRRRLHLVRVLVIHAEEEWAIGPESWKLARAGAIAEKVNA